jgi:hypothetical protein
MPLMSRRVLRVAREAPFRRCASGWAGQCPSSRCELLGRRRRRIAKSTNLRYDRASASSPRPAPPAPPRMRSPHEDLGSPADREREPHPGRYGPPPSRRHPARLKGRSSLPPAGRSSVVGTLAGGARRGGCAVERGSEMPRPHRHPSSNQHYERAAASPCTEKSVRRQQRGRRGSDIWVAPVLIEARGLSASVDMQPSAVVATLLRTVPVVADPVEREQCSGLVDQVLWRAREGRAFPSE